VAVQLAPATTLVLAGQLMLGAVWSTTVTVNVQDALLFAASVAVNVTTWSWSPKVMTVPETGLCAMLGLAVQSSFAVAADV
jgi:hypothetical protein